MARRHKGGIAPQEEISPNVIPMIDIMFLLLLFLMVAADMGAREYEEVSLPTAQNVQEDKEEKQKDRRTTVNVYHEKEIACAAFEAGDVCSDEAHWRIGIRGIEYTRETVKDKLKVEADARRPPNDLSAPSELRVMIRADKSALYGFVQKVMNACALAGIWKVEFGAAEPVK
jgi:biopolymer transport protein ExbD